eukprot:TRINITY_DN4168_c0_g1_i4.p2 TRINITY_DN4168_c0_g1~~TRINITY_DN4168_c0_g1_i4.p2  ORF type:complete len:138 (-),score=11.02 TRINITY_DN4168_c0_g1_i4:58-471(-)
MAQRLLWLERQQQECTTSGGWCSLFEGLLAVADNYPIVACSTISHNSFTLRALDCTLLSSCMRLHACCRCPLCRATQSSAPQSWRACCTPYYWPHTACCLFPRERTAGSALALNLIPHEIVCQIARYDLLPPHTLVC